MNLVHRRRKSKKNCRLWRPSCSRHAKRISHAVKNTRRSGPSAQAHHQPGCPDTRRGASCARQSLRVSYDTSWRCPVRGRCLAGCRAARWTSRRTARGDPTPASDCAQRLRQVARARRPGATRPAFRCGRAVLSAGVGIVGLQPWVLLALRCRALPPAGPMPAAARRSILVVGDTRMRPSSVYQSTVRQGERTRSRHVDGWRVGCRLDTPACTCSPFGGGRNHRVHHTGGAKIGIGRGGQIHQVFNLVA